MAKVSTETSVSPDAGLAAVNVRLFAGAAEAAGVRFQPMSIECGATVDDLFDRIAVDFPMLASMKSCLKFAVNQEFVDVDRTLSHGDEVAVIPPVSGG